MTTPALQIIAREGIAAAKAGHKERARELLLEVVEKDEQNLAAWLWLSSVVDNLADKRVCLENVLTLDPNHRAARAGLAWLDQQAPQYVGPPFAGPQAAASPEKTRPESTLLPCPFCQQPVPRRAATCRHCGYPLAMDCPACTAPVDVRVRLCPQCQHDMGDARQSATYFANLALAYAERQRHAQTLTAWQLVEAMDPRRPQLAWHLAQAQLELGQVNQAMANLERTLEQEPQHLAACQALGEIMGQMHRWQESESYLNRALEADPKSAPAHLALGQVLMDQDKLKDAFRHIQQATKLDAHNGAAWLRLGRLYELAGEHTQATHSYRRAVSTLPPASLESKEAQRRLEALHPPLPEAMLTSNLELARQMTGPVLICALSALLDAGLRPWWIPWTGWAALALGTAGAFLWVSTTSLPRNPLIQQLVDDQGLRSTPLRAVTGAMGALCWLAAMFIILWPADMSAWQTGL